MLCRCDKLVRELAALVIFILTRFQMYPLILSYVMVLVVHITCTLWASATKDPEMTKSFSFDAQCKQMSMPLPETCRTHPASRRMSRPSTRRLLTFSSRPPSELQLPCRGILPQDSSPMSSGSMSLSNTGPSQAVTLPTPAHCRRNMLGRR